MILLYLCHRIPFPPNKGEKIRAFHEIKHLSKRHEIHLLSFCDDPKDAQYAEALRKYCRNVTLIPLQRLRQRIRALLALLNRKPWTLGYFSTPEMWTAVREAVRNSRCDAIFVFSSSMAPYAIWNKEIPKLLDFVDSDASKWLQYARYKGVPAAWLYAYEGKKLARFERKMIEAFDASVFVSAREAGHLLDLGCRGKIHFVQNGIDLDHFAGTQPAAASGNIIFTGVMDYFPNTDAVTFFAREVLPRVRSSYRDAQFLIVGSHPTSAVQRLGRLPGVTVTGTVPDIRPFLAESRVAVVPMRISQGIQNKILEALAAGLPVVTTPAAAAGFASIGDMPVAVAADATAFAHHVVKFLQEPLTPGQISICRRHLRQHYDWDTNLSAIDGLLEHAAAIEPRARSENP